MFFFIFLLVAAIGLVMVKVVGYYDNFWGLLLYIGGYGTVASFLVYFLKFTLFHYCHMEVKTFPNFEEAEAFAMPLLATHYVDIFTEGDVTTVRWKKRTTYIDVVDNVEKPEEVWMTRDNRMIYIQDLSPDHARNIIRMMIKAQTEQAARLSELLKSTATSLFSDDPFLVKKNSTLH